MNPGKSSCPTAAIIVFIAMAFAGATPVHAAPPIVSNVRAAQRSGTGLVDIYHDVADASGDRLFVTIAVSFNSGTTYTGLDKNLSGPGYGRDIVPGNNQHIIWNAGMDLEPFLYRNVRVKITTDDGYAHVTPQMVYVPFGSFTMGDNYSQGGTEERPTHVSTSSGQAPNHPVQYVSWYDAVKWANARSEAEWEKAARGGLVGHHFPWPSLGGNYASHIDGSKANYGNSSDPFENKGDPFTTPVGYYNGQQTPVGSDMANGYGLYDMAGNVWEWCWDWYDGSWYGQSSATQDNTRGPVSGSDRVLRGGGFYTSPDDCRVANRDGSTTVLRGHYLGFRLAIGQSQ